jgi:hypothetical protein
MNLSNSFLLFVVFVLFVSSVKFANASNLIWIDSLFSERPEWPSHPPSIKQVISSENAHQPVIESPCNLENVKLIKRTQLLERALHQTLQALSVKLGHTPFDDIISSLERQTESSSSYEEVAENNPDSITASRAASTKSIIPECTQMRL